MRNPPAGAVRPLQYLALDPRTPAGPGRWRIHGRPGRGHGPDEKVGARRGSSRWGDRRGHERPHDVGRRGYDGRNTVGRRRLGPRSRDRRRHGRRRLRTAAPAGAAVPAATAGPPPSALVPAAQRLPHTAVPAARPAAGRGGTGHRGPGRRPPHMGSLERVRRRQGPGGDRTQGPGGGGRAHDARGGGHHGRGPGRLLPGRLRPRQRDEHPVRPADHTRRLGPWLAAGRGRHRAAAHHRRPPPDQGRQGVLEGPRLRGRPPRPDRRPLAGLLRRPARDRRPDDPSGPGQRLGAAP